MTGFAKVARSPAIVLSVFTSQPRMFLMSEDATLDIAAQIIADARVECLKLGE